MTPRLRPARTVAALLAMLSPAFALAQTPDIPDEPPPPPVRRAPSEAGQSALSRARPAPAADAPADRAVASGAVRGEATAIEGARYPEPEIKAGRLAPSVSGETGLIRVGAADSVRPRIIRLSLGLDYFSVSSFFSESDSHRHFGGTLAISVSPINFLELWLNYRLESNNNARTTPQLLQAQGDLTLGAKGFYPLSDVFTAGIDAQVALLTGIGQSSFDLGASQLRLRGLLTGDFQKTANLPLRAHLNTGVTFDGSNKLASGMLSNAERFALGISDFTRIGIGLGVELPFKFVTPFLEYTIELPLGYKATPGVVLARSALRTTQEMVSCDPTMDATDAGCARPIAGRAIPQRLTPGVRITAIPDLTLDVAVEIGITPDKATGILATPPYNVVLLASYPIDPFHTATDRGPPIAVPVLVPEKEPAPPAGRVEGVVKGKDGARIAGAVITFDRAPPVATSADGHFKSFDLEPGPVAITVTREGFETATAKSDVIDGAPIELEVELVPMVKEGSVRGRVIDDQSQPIAQAPIELSGPTSAQATTGADGTFELKAASGKHTITISPRGYLKTARALEIQGAETTLPDIVVRKRPKKAIAELSGDRIVIKERVHFVNNEARLAPDAAPVLDNVADVLIANPQLKKVRVEGHTDNVGSDAANLQLSKDRAEAVVRYLVQQGIDPKRLMSEGFGASHPVAPNLTRRGREQNRRVELAIVEQ